MRMTKFLALSLLTVFSLMIVASPAIADTISIDTETASYEEIVEALTLLRKTQIERLTQQFTSERIIESASGIVFRGTPWLSTRAEAEEVFGTVSWDYDHIYSDFGTVYTNGIGACTEYKDWTLAGYPVTKAEVNYVYPVLDGMLLRDDDLALLYLAIYNLWDIGDVNAAVDDISLKLSKLYGEYERKDNVLIWKDGFGNSVSIRYSSSRITIMYRYSDAERLLNEADQAVKNESARNEELLRIKNSDNYDGL